MPAYVPVKARQHRYRQFARKYIKNGCNGLQTVLDCGFTDNPDSAKVIAARLLTYVYVDNEISKLQAKAKMDADEVVERLSDIARADIADVLEPDGSFDISSAKARNTSKLIKSLKFDKDSGKVIGLETYSAHEAQRDVGKIHALFTDKVESSVSSFDSSSFKAKMSRNIAKLASKSGDDPLEIEREYQISYADKSDEDYSADLDASVHPEVWPSGDLISKPQVVDSITEIGDQ